MAKCWCGKCHPYKHWVANWKLYELRGGEVPKPSGKNKEA